MAGSKRFTVYVERDVAIHVDNDRQAATIAERVDDAIEQALSGADLVTVYARTACHRGEVHKQVFDRERGHP